jgi:hypothetical protein
MHIEIQPDLAAAVADMAALNGLTAEGYVNNLIELGLSCELKSGHTMESVRAFMTALRAAGKPDWTLLDSGEDPETCDECGAVIPDDAEGVIGPYHETSCSCHPANSV